MNEIEKVRKGNDIEILWEINAEQEGAQVPYDLEGKDLSLYIHNQFGRTKAEGFKVEGNILMWTFFGKDQKHVGKYTLTLVENEGKEGMHTVDECYAFALVSRSCEVGGEAESTVKLVHLRLTSNMYVQMLTQAVVSITVDTELSETSTNPVQNAVITAELNKKADSEEVSRTYAKTEYVDDELNKKQDSIDDLDTIRQNAEKGATAVQTKDLAKVATSGSYNDLSDKPAIPSEVTEDTVTDWGFTKNTGTYVMPNSGIPKSDLSNDVQTSLGKADTALQEHQDISGKQDKLISGENIKTINGKSILGSGNIVIEGGSGGSTDLTGYATEDYVNNKVRDKVDKVEGKGLSANDYTNEDKQKLGGIAEGAEVNVQSDWDVTDESSDAFIKNKPEIPAAVTEDTVSGWGFTKNEGTYSKPDGGIPKSDMSSDVQGSLNKADTALQEIPSEYVTETEMNTALSTRNAGMEDTEEFVEDVDIPPYVKFVEQELTEEQKEQARKNIGVDGIPVIEHGTSDTTFTLTPNVFHVWGEVDSLSLSFGEEQSGVMNEYMFQFSSGTNAAALSLPEGIEWENGAYPEILANATHQVSIVNGLASIAHYYTRKYLTIEALENGLTFTFSKDLEYRVNEGKWETLSANTASPSFESGDKIQLRAELVPGTTSTTYGIGTFTISKSCNLSGNCMSLLFRDNAAQSNLAGYDFAFYKLFNGCTTIKSVSEDFLTSPVVTQYCYSAMFRGCSGLTSSSTLPALTLAKGSYDYMYDGCSNLQYIKMLATDISAEGCLTNWVSGVASSGTFVKNKNATWTTTGVSGIPSGWTVQTE